MTSEPPLASQRNHLCILSLLYTIQGLLKWGEIVVVSSWCLTFLFAYVNFNKSLVTAYSYSLCPVANRISLKLQQYKATTTSLLLINRNTTNQCIFMSYFYQTGHFLILLAILQIWPNMFWVPTWILMCGFESYVYNLYTNLCNNMITYRTIVRYCQYPCKTLKCLWEHNTTKQVLGVRWLHLFNC